MMGRRKNTYKKLPGKRFVRQALWQGPDHLLWVEGNLVQEHYRRFYFRDIQALVICRSGRRTLWSLVWGSLSLFCGLIAWLVPGTPYVSLTFTVLWGLLLAFNLLLGASCDVYLQTAVQLERINTLVRVRKASRVLHRIKALAEEAQGVLDRQSLAGRAAALRAAGGPGPQPVAVGAPDDRDGGEIPFSPLLHWILFGLLTSAGILRVAQWWLRSLSVSAVDMLVLAVALVLSVVVLAYWHRHVKGSLVATASWLALAFVIIHGAAAYGFFIAASIQHPEAMYHHGMMFKAFLELQTTAHVAVKVYLIGNAAASLAVGLLGLAAVAEWENRRSKPAAV